MMSIRTTRLRGATLGAAMVLSVAGLSACAESGGPEAGAVTTQDLQGLEERLGALDERVGVLEDDPVDTTPGGAVEVPPEPDNAGFFADPRALLGQEVTVSAEVSATMAGTQTGAAFRIAGDGDENAIGVIAPQSSVQVDGDDVVRVTGTVVQVAQDSFEQDFGIAADDLFDDPDAFFAEAKGDVALNATEVEVLQEQADQT
jgi:hypothetical protein